VAVTLVINGKGGKPLKDHGTLSPSTSEIIWCNGVGCEMSYTLAYGVNDIRIHRQEFVNVVELLRRTATALLTEGHPRHSTKTFLWKGPKKGWK
jgi:hypothetical protein